MVREFYRGSPLLWSTTLPKKLRDSTHYSPTRMPAHQYQNARDVSSLQRQAEVHLNVAALMSAFAFAAASTEATTQTTAPAPIDQGIFITLALATVLLLGTVLHFMYLDMGLGTRGGRHYFMAYSAKLGISCVSFHCGCAMLMASFPLWAYRKFDLQPATFVAVACAAGWLVYDLFVLLCVACTPLTWLHSHCAPYSPCPASPSHARMNQLLDAAFMGIDVSKEVRYCGPLSMWGSGIGLSENFTEEMWARMHAVAVAESERDGRGRDGQKVPTSGAPGTGSSPVVQAAAASATLM